MVVYCLRNVGARGIGYMLGSSRQACMARYRIYVFRHWMMVNEIGGEVTVIEGWWGVRIRDLIMIKRFDS